MTRRQLLAAMTGCAVAKMDRDVVMVPKRYGMALAPGRFFDLVMMDDITARRETATVEEMWAYWREREALIKKRIGV